MIRMLLADDEPLVPTGIAMILSAEQDIEVVVVVVGDGSAAFARVSELSPDGVVMDIRMQKSTAWKPPGGSSIPSRLTVRPSRSWSWSWCWS